MLKKMLTAGPFSHMNRPVPACALQGGTNDMLQAAIWQQSSIQQVKAANRKVCADHELTACVLLLMLTTL
jgi:hypothetical protein